MNKFRAEVRWAWMCWLCIALFAALPCGAVTLKAGAPAVTACDQIRVHPGAGLQGLGVAEIAAREGDFRPAQRPCGNYGVQADGVWLLLPLTLDPAAAARRWMLEIDYAPLDTIEVHLLRAGRPVWHAGLGDRMAHAERATPLRAHSVALPLDQPGAWTLLVQVRSSGALLAPLRLLEEDALIAHEARTQTLQGMLVGMALMLALYGLLHCATLRDATYLAYVLQVLAMSAFFIAFSGIGAQHLWPQHGGWTAPMVRGSVLVGLAANAVFADRVLAIARTSVPLSLALRWLAMASGLGALSMCTGLLPGTAAHWLVLMLVPTAMLLFLLAGLAALLRGHLAAGWVLAGWLFLALGVFVVIGVQWGLLPSNFWTLNAYQFGTVFDMVAWLRVIGLHSQHLRAEAELARRERDRLESLAHSDPLTGALNRRGLERLGSVLIGQAGADAPAALYLVDLDDFKSVNDRYGHEAGDQVLVEVARRVRQQLRADDLVARLGGDEFVIVAAALSSPPAAQQLATKLALALAEPMRLRGHLVQLRASIGHALAPFDGRDCATLIGLADDAMYGHKRQAKTGTFSPVPERA